MVNRCLYIASFKEFLEQERLAVLGALHNNYHGETLTTTVEAWMGEIEILQQMLQPWKEEDAQIIFEYEIPRLGKRIDVVLLLRGIIFCLEFKVNQKDALQADVEQVMDYALDLKNFHRFSHDKVIVPILIPTIHVSSTTEFKPSVYDDQIYNPLISGAEHLQELVASILIHAGATVSGTIENWIISPYTPTPTIIEAARALYENHTGTGIGARFRLRALGCRPAICRRRLEFLQVQRKEQVESRKQQGEPEVHAQRLSRAADPRPPGNHHLHSQRKQPAHTRRFPRRPHATAGVLRRNV